MTRRFVTAASLFDGHDASINIMRRLLQRHGAEVVHLGHNRSVDDVVAAVVEEDPHGVAVSSYQGGHVEYFTYLSIGCATRATGTSRSTAVAAVSSSRPRSKRSRRTASPASSPRRTASASVSTG